MPTYEYVCNKCEHEFEVFQPITADPLGTCPKDECPNKRWGKGSVSRAISGGAGLLFKGTGFYITDYRSESYKADAKKDAPAEKSKPTTEPASKPDKKSTGGSNAGGNGKAG